jgi:putative ABC transport system permease protein
MRLPIVGIDITRLLRSAGLAIRSLWLHKLRAFLSVLGIIIGTSAVIALMAFGKGSMQDALEDIKRQGATNIIVRSIKPPEDSATSRRSMVASYGLKFADFHRLATLDGITRLVPMRIFPQEIRYLERMHMGRVVATTSAYAEVNQLFMAKGSFLTPEHDQKMSNVCVLGSLTADRLFPFEDPLDHSITLGTHQYRIVGIVKDRMPTGGTGGSQAAEDYNSDIYLPMETSRRRFGDIIMIRASGSRSGEKVELSQITLTVDADVDTDEGRERVKAMGILIREQVDAWHLKKDWVATVPLDRLEEAERQQDRFTRLLVLIASISLVVGGIGIMNIMLATVTERTREIGIRRALGARRKDITQQFLIEAVVQTTVGGILGVILGLSAVFFLPVIWAQFSDSKLPAVLHEWSVFISLGVSICVGVLFGWYPASRASKLDPIEALRHE